MVSEKDKTKMEKGKIKKRVSIVVKMLLSTFLFTIAPLVITSSLIIYTYQSLVDDILAKSSTGFMDGIGEELFSSLQNARIQAILTVFIVIILTLFSNIITSRNLTRPLGKLAKGTDEIAKGNLDYKIEVESNDELGELAAHFNQMMQQLKEMNVALEGSKKTLEMRVEARTRDLQKMAEALEEARATLEVKVKARTEELESLTKSLEVQVKERTKELESKLDELEKFRKFAIGRELRMKELKEELKKIKGV